MLSALTSVASRARHGATRRDRRNHENGEARQSPHRGRLRDRVAAARATAHQARRALRNSHSGIIPQDNVRGPGKANTPKYRPLDHNQVWGRRYLTIRAILAGTHVAPDGLLRPHARTLPPWYCRRRLAASRAAAPRTMMDCFENGEDDKSRYAAASDAWGKAGTTNAKNPPTFGRMGVIRSTRSGSSRCPNTASRRSTSTMPAITSASPPGSCASRSTRSATTGRLSPTIIRARPIAARTTRARSPGSISP